MTRPRPRHTFEHVMTQEVTMPLFLDIHSIVIDLTTDEVASIHRGIDERVPGARCLRHWVNGTADRLFCLVEADDAVLAQTVHASFEGVTTVECHPVSEHI
jgi:hypothetical protein